MNRRLAMLASDLASAATWTWAALADCWRTLMAVQVRAYRPEAYYMRGPGPKWREKHARAARPSCGRSEGGFRA